MRISTVFENICENFSKEDIPHLPYRQKYSWCDRPFDSFLGRQTLCKGVRFVQRDLHFSQLWVLRYGSLYRCISNVWSNVVELTKLKSKEVDLPFLFKDTKSDCRWIEYWLRHALARPSVSIQCKLQFWRRVCDLIRYMYSSLQARRPSGTCCWRHKCNNWTQV